MRRIKREPEQVMDLGFIHLANGSVAVVDAVDLPLVAQYNWSSNRGYAYTCATTQQWILMHRLILGVKPGSKVHVDHINGDPLDNRRANLREVDCATNLHNLKVARRNNRSGASGVLFDRARQKWLAFGTLHRRHHHIGRYATREEAITARDLWVIRHRDPLATTIRPRSHYATVAA